MAQAKLLFPEQPAEGGWAMRSVPAPCRGHRPGVPENRLGGWQAVLRAPPPPLPTGGEAPHPCPIGSLVLQGMGVGWGGSGGSREAGRVQPGHVHLLCPHLSWKGTRLHPKIWNPRLGLHKKGGKGKTASGQGLWAGAYTDRGSCGREEATPPLCREPPAASLRTGLSRRMHSARTSPLPTALGPSGPLSISYSQYIQASSLLPDHSVPLPDLGIC